MWFSKVTSLGAVCNTTTSFDDEPCDHQKEGWCPRVVESDRVRNNGGGTGKNTTEIEIVYECFFRHEPNFFVIL